jgi:uncharacterized protein YjbI with pentapeptide repeats
MNTLTKFFNPLETQGPKGAQYEIIENEIVKDCNLGNLNVSGSLFSLTTFENVTFESCVFFGSKMENCKFVNCRFINCSFQFSNIMHCNFGASTFVNTKWDYTPIKKSVFENCELDAKTYYFISRDENRVENTDLDTYMEQALGKEAVLGPWNGPLSSEESDFDEATKELTIIAA